MADFPEVMRADHRPDSSGRSLATPPDPFARRFTVRGRAAGALSAVVVLFALMTSGAWAETEAPTEPTPSESPSESPSPEPSPSPGPTSNPSPTATPTPKPPPAESSDDDKEDSDDEDSDDEESDDDESEDESEGGEPEPAEPGEPATETPTPPTPGAPESFNPALRIVSTVFEPADHDGTVVTADFDWHVSGTSLVVDFTDTSMCTVYYHDDGSEVEEECYVNGWEWDFGDGTSEDDDENPTHEFPSAGTYKVTLTAFQLNRFTVDSVDLVGPAESTPCGIDFCDSVTFEIAVGPPNASFEAVPQIGPAPLTVKFQDTSTGNIASTSWSFTGPACGKATASPNEKQFVEVFPTVGTCVVTLRVNAPPAPSPGPSFGPGAAAFDPDCNCSIASKTITVTKKPPFIPNEDDDDGDSDDSDDSDDGDPSPGGFLPNRPPLTEQPTPEPTDPSPSPGPTSKPITPVTPPTPAEPVDPRPASWITGEGATGAGLTLMILAAVIGSLRGLSMASRRVALVADRDENTIQRHVAAREAEGWGDRSFTWRFPGHRLIDAASVVLPDRLFRFSPLVGRIAEDGSEFRAMFGTLWLATPLAGIALGIASAAAAGGRALPPSALLVMAGAVLATFDAFSGALAVVLFAGAALLGGFGGTEGGPDLIHSILVILAIGFLWMAIPLIGSAIRPFRRLGDGSLRHRWDVLGDGLIAALLCAWVAQKLVQAMDLFAGQKTGLPEHANTIALVVMAAVALRVTMEHFAMSAYPQRLQQVEGEDPPPPFLLSVVLGAFIRTAVFGFIGYAFIGSCWQLWLGIGLFLIPQLIDHLRERFRNFGFVQRLLPRGIVEIFILVVACTLAARFAMDQSGDSLSGIRLAFLLIAVPPALLGALRVFAEDPDETGDTTWPREFLGAIIVAVTAVLAARGWDY